LEEDLLRFLVQRWVLYLLAMEFGNGFRPDAKQTKNIMELNSYSGLACYEKNNNATER
jgi:hypothetical protein